jgi:hypothetical protein
MLIAASRWFGRSPRGAARLSGSGSAPLSLAVRRRLFQQSCLQMQVGGPVPIPGPCRAIRTAYGLSNGLSPRRHAQGTRRAHHRSVGPISHGNRDRTRANLAGMHPTKEARTMRRKLTVAAAILAFGAGTAGGVGVAQAKHGSDDPPNHEAHHRHHHHHHHGHHRDDGRHHT